MKVHSGTGRLWAVYIQLMYSYMDLLNKKAKEDGSTSSSISMEEEMKKIISFLETDKELRINEADSSKSSGYDFEHSTSNLISYIYTVKYIIAT